MVWSLGSSSHGVVARVKGVYSWRPLTTRWSWVEKSSVRKVASLFRLECEQQISPTSSSYSGFDYRRISTIRCSKYSTVVEGHLFSSSYRTGRWIFSSNDQWDQSQMHMQACSNYDGFHMYLVQFASVVPEALPNPGFGTAYNSTAQ